MTATVAAVPADLQQLYDQGDFRNAANLAVQRARGDASAYTFAARSVLALAYARRIDGETPTDLYREAERLARVAISIDPESEEARLQLVVALGRIADSLSSISEAADMAEEVRSNIDAALRLAPNDPRAEAASGAWHVLGRAKAGLIGSALIGASRATGMKQLDQAVAAAPGDLQLLTHYGETVMEGGLEEDRPKAVAALRRALEIEPRTEIDRLSRKHARRLLRQLAGLAD